MNRIKEQKKERASVDQAMMQITIFLPTIHGTIKVFVEGQAFL